VWQIIIIIIIIALSPPAAVAVATDGGRTDLLLLLDGTGGIGIIGMVLTRGLLKCCLPVASTLLLIRLLLVFAAPLLPVPLLPLLHPEITVEKPFAVIAYWWFVVPHGRIEPNAVVPALLIPRQPAYAYNKGLIVWRRTHDQL
jgi:hypothetical protein